MRTNVTFRHPAEFTTSSETDGILAASGTGWFREILVRIPGLAVYRKPVQEDWGAVYFADRGGYRFWVGVSFWGDGVWVARVHHRSSAWLQRLTPKGKTQRGRLAKDLHTVLLADANVSEIRWYSDADLPKSDAIGADAPDADLS